MSALDIAARGVASRALGRIEPLRALTLNPASVRRVAIFGDSFVGGAPGPADTFAVTFAAALRARYGDAGAGYVPFFDGKMAGITHSPNFTSPDPNGPGTQFYRWDADARKKLMFGGFGYYRDGGQGNDDDYEYLAYLPNTADSFQRGATETMAHVRLYFAIRSARAGFQMRQSDMNPALAPNYSSGASFTGAVAGKTLTASAVSGVIPRFGARLFGGVTATTTTAGGGANKGGAGTYEVNTSQTVASTAMTADPNIETALNLPQTADYVLDPAYNQTPQILSAYGDLVFSGIEHFNGNAGVTVTDFGLGGALAYQFASLDADAQRRFFELANFDLVIFVLGMNDRGRPEGNFGSDMARLVSWAQRGSKTKVLLVRQTDPADIAASTMQNFAPVLQNVARSFGCGFYDMRSAAPSLASYAAASAAGLMADSVHLTQAANTIIGNDLARLIAF